MAAFEQVIRLQMEKVGPAIAKRRHIEIARRGLAKYMGGQAAKPGYTIETDGNVSSSEESVRPYGLIVYRFTRLRQIAEFALQEARRLSPAASGRYRASWFVMANNAEIPPDAITGSMRDIMITNDQPYSRKINVGAKGFEKYAHPGIAEKVKELVKRRFGRTVEARVVFITLSGGYTLKTAGRRRGRRGRRAQRELNYPSVRITAKY